jgi:hypothetical protein
LIGSQRHASGRKNILTVEVDSSVFEELAPAHLRKVFEVDRLPSAAAALELVSLVPFAAIILKHPLRGMTTDEFLAAVRRNDSASRQAQVALLTEPGNGNVSSYLARGVSLTLTMEDPAEEREQLICSMLGIQPRHDARVLVKLEVIVTDSESDHFVAQTKDVSVSGMFVITRKRHPIGSIARFEFNLLGDPKPVRGNAEVVRHSEPGDPQHGMGFRFLTFDETGGQRLKRFIETTR